jgi:hypothetical protein
MSRLSVLDKSLEGAVNLSNLVSKELRIDEENLKRGIRQLGEGKQQAGRHPRAKIK